MTKIVNLLTHELAAYEEGPAGRRFSADSLTGVLGATLTGCGIYELEPGEATWPYHFELGEEEWLIVIAGEVTARTPDGERVLHAGDVACFPAGVTGAHAVRNEGPAVARFAMPSSSSRFADGAVYPDSGTFVVRGPGFRHRGKLGEAVEYWEGEA